MGLGAGIRGVGELPVSRLGGNPAPFLYDFDLNDITFTPGMAKRTGQAAFDVAMMGPQGKWDGTGTPDIVTFPRGTLLGNQAQFFYSNLDMYQGSISFWITPEWDGDDGLQHVILDSGTTSDVLIRKLAGNSLDASIGGQSRQVDISGWVAGTSYHVVISWDSKNTLDGTNYIRISINDAHTFGATTQLAVDDPQSTIAVGSSGTAGSADALIEGFCISRVPFYDGSYGCPMWFDESGPVDVIAAIYAAGAGADPAQIFGSWDCTLFLPTDQATGALTTGTGEAWSHPHGSELIDVPFCDDGGLPGTDYAVEFDGTTTVIDCGSDAGLDDVGSGGDMTVDIWFRADSDGENDSGSLFNKWTSLGNGGYYAQLNATDDQFYVLVECDTTDAVAIVDASAFDIEGDAFVDGKWHLLTVHYEDTANKRISVAVDGRWASAYDTRTDGVGNYTSDASHNFRIGVQDQATTDAWDGGIAWCEVSDNDRHTAGTDFIAPRTGGYNDGNTVADWPMDEGTGATVDNAEGTAARDGTITSGSWSAIWEIVGTPEIPQSLQFFEENDGIDFGSGANIDDPFGADCTIEFWARLPTTASNAYVMSKGTGALGWYVLNRAAGEVRVVIWFATTNIILDIAGAQDNRWHHFALDFDVGTLTARWFLDGVNVGTGTGTGVGAYQVDALYNCLVNAVQVIGAQDGNMAIGWIRLSDNRRYTGNSFIPAARNNPPANDANAQLLINMDDGAGATATDSSGNGYNGTVTFGASTRWNNTPDLLRDEPGRMIYNQGYNIGSDGANDGIYIPHTLTAATDYVIRVPLQYSPRAWPRITLYDVTGAGSIVDFDAPPLTPVHDGAANAAAFTDTGEVFPASLIGGTIYNVTDGSSGTITAVGGTNQDTITATLAGGTDNDWDVGDQAYIVPPDGWVFNEPIVAHTSANTAYELRITNRNSDGIITVHQAEVLESVHNNGDMESGAGNPWIPTGWTNSGLDPGDTVAEAAIVHAGAQSMEWAAGAATTEFIYQACAGVANDAYYSGAVWIRSDGAAGKMRYGPASSAQAVLHNGTSDNYILSTFAGVWSLLPAVWRKKAVTNTSLLPSFATASQMYADDLFVIALDDITLTVTPASEANSTETPTSGNTGIRVDGLDECTVPAATHRVLATSGGIRFRVTPRHSLANSEAFGQPQERLFSIVEDANNYIELYRDDAAGGTLTLEVDQAGAGPWTDTDTPAWAADTEALIWIINQGGSVQCYVDGVLLLEIGALTGFAADFTQPAYFGSEATPDYEADAVISPP